MGGVMRGVRSLLCVLGVSLAIGGCASPQAQGDKPPLAFAEERQPACDILKRPGDSVSLPAPSGSLAGRTIRVSRVADIRLAPREVVLTFDDGPMPGKTASILDTLDRYGVKATFLVVGQMARAYPDLVRKVAGRGHTIGSHTQNHKNLRSIGYAAAIEQIDHGRQSIAAAMGPSRRGGGKFFRFPYLADTAALRSHLAAEGIVVLDAQVDSKDYFQSSPDQVRQRILSRLGANGSGIILMHDIHARTGAMLPGLLADLKSRGFRVVHLAPGGGGGGSLVASAE
jgi:peptidoglycan/xylan/chitin deacetylase (PgdA/CDA1 family)